VWTTYYFFGVSESSIAAVSAADSFVAVFDGVRVFSIAAVRLGSLVVDTVGASERNMSSCVCAVLADGTEGDATNGNQP